MSCVGLLAFVGGGGEEGSLFLVDDTGAHRARALAVGDGSARINDRLTRIDFSIMAKEEAAKRLLRLVKEEGFGASAEDKRGRAGWALPRSTRVEIAVLDSSRATMRRLRQ